jgi:hypothetical protein
MTAAFIKNDEEYEDDEDGETEVADEDDGNAEAAEDVAADEDVADDDAGWQFGQWRTERHWGLLMGNSGSACDWLTVEGLVQARCTVIRQHTWSVLLAQSQMLRSTMWSRLVRVVLPYDCNDFEELFPPLAACSSLKVLRLQSTSMGTLPMPEAWIKLARACPKLRDICTECPLDPDLKASFPPILDLLDLVTRLWPALLRFGSPVSVPDPIELSQLLDDPLTAKELYTTFQKEVWSQRRSRRAFLPRHTVKVSKLRVKVSKLRRKLSLLAWDPDSNPFGPGLMRPPRYPGLTHIFLSVRNQSLHMTPSFAYLVLRLFSRHAQVIPHVLCSPEDEELRTYYLLPADVYPYNANSRKLDTLRKQLFQQVTACRRGVGWEHLGPVEQEESDGIDELVWRFEGMALT